MRFAEKCRLPAILCALALIVCAFAARPFAETGIIDDWSYIRTAQLLAQTGHIVYNGWPAAMIGWQLLLAAVLIKLFGFSFTIARMSILLVAAATAFLTQRTFVRAGIGEWNATLATLTFVLSPLFLPLSVCFMTDVPGIFAIVVCLYGCLRALQASTTAASVAWIIFASLTNAVGGTARQVAWLGVLVMVPCTIWLLRRQRRVVMAGAASVVVGISMITGLIHWFSRQPHVDLEPAVIPSFGPGALRLLLNQFRLVPLAVSLLLLPVFLMFVPAIRQSGRRAIAVATVALVVCVGWGVKFHSSGELGVLAIPPFFDSHGNVVGAAGILESVPVFGGRPEWSTRHGRIVLSIIVVISLVSAISVICSGNHKQLADQPPDRVSWRSLLAILLPFLVAYLFLLMPRATSTGLYDRYLLPILIVTVLLAVRYYQDYVRPTLPFTSLALVALAAATSVAGTHNLIAMFRSTLIAANEVNASGVPRTAIDAGWEYNGLTELNTTGWVLPNRTVLALKDRDIPSQARAGTCPRIFISLFAHVLPRYSVSFEPNACGGGADFSPVTYSMWLPRRKVTIFVVKNPIAN